jgi:hypothetical protein
MTMIRSAAPVARRPMAKAVAPAAAAKPVAAAQAVAKAPAPRPVQAKENEWTVGRIAKTAGTGAAAFVGGSVSTFVADLFFHFGNNGGTAWPGGIYLAAAGLAAAGARALYAHFSKK